MSRGQRKLDHIRYALEIGDSKISTGFEDIRFLHNCLTPVNPDQVDTTTYIADVKLNNPVFIDAITGGTAEVTAINRQLAQAAHLTGCAMAVGSQYGTVRHGLPVDSYQVVRQVNPDGVVFANVSALATPQEAAAAVDMLGAAALEIHLNVAQELLMPEGDRDFASLKDNLKALQDKVTVPVIIKETGCGMAYEQIQELMEMGFACFNVAGAGGTSFAAIEAARSGSKRQQAFADWGIPTAWSVLEAKRAGAPCLIASGGIRNGFDGAKALAMGAAAVGMSGNVLAALQKEGVEGVTALLRDALADIKDIMLLTGYASLESFKKARLIYTGATLDFINKH